MKKSSYQCECDRDESDDLSNFDLVVIVPSKGRQRDNVEVTEHFQYVHPLFLVHSR